MELPVGSRFWRTNSHIGDLGGTQEYRIVEIENGMWFCDHFWNGGFVERCRYNPEYFSWPYYTIEYPKSKNFNSLYEKLSNQD